LGPSQKTFRPSWRPKLVADLIVLQSIGSFVLLLMEEQYLRHDSCLANRMTFLSGDSSASFENRYVK